MAICYGGHKTIKVQTPTDKALEVWNFSCYLGVLNRITFIKMNVPREGQTSLPSLGWFDLELLASGEGESH